MGRLLVLDGLLTFWVTLSIFSAWQALDGPNMRRGWWLLAALACGLGILTKGPVALVLLLPPLLIYRWMAPSTPRIGPRLVGVHGSRAAGGIAVVRRRLSACARFRTAFSLGSQRSALRAAFRSRQADLVLHADPAGRHVARDTAGAPVLPFPNLKGNRILAPIRAGLSAADGWLVRAVFLAVGVEAADVCSAGLSPFGTGDRRLPGASTMAHVHLVSRRYGRLVRPGDRGA